jgi:hypothetical protein
VRFTAALQRNWNDEGKESVQSGIDFYSAKCRSFDEAFLLLTLTDTKFSPNILYFLLSVRLKFLSLGENTNSSFLASSYKIF